MSHEPVISRGFFRSLALSVVGLLVLCGAGSSGVPAATELLPPDAVAPTTQERSLAPRVASILEQNHYRHIPIDERLSPQVLERFLTALDPQHSYFMASDIAGFDRWRLRFGDMIHTGEIDPAYLIFYVFQQRNREHMDYALKLLDTEPDWTREESFDFDREHAAWPSSQAEIDELWRLRVKNDAISLLLTGKSWADTADTLRKRYQRVLTRLDKITPEDVFESLMNAYASAYDPHSNYFSPRSSEEYRIQMSLSYEGIGASLQLTDDYVTVTNVLPGGPAAVDGTLKPNDRITAVAQGNDGTMTDVIGWRLDDVVQLIRGKVGTIVRLQILPAGATPGTAERMLRLTRNKVTLEAQAAKKEVRTLPREGHNYKIGIITVPSFYNDMEDGGAGNAEIKELRIPLVGDENVRCLDVAVHHQIAVRVVDCGANRDKQLQALAYEQRAAVAIAIDRLAIDIFHGEESAPVGLADVEHPAHVRMRNLTRQANFTREPIQRLFCLRQRPCQKFQCHRLPEF